MPRGCRWIFVNRNERDDCCSQIWDTYIARDRAGSYYVCARGDEVSIERLGDAAQLVGFFEDYGPDALEKLQNALMSLPGTGDVLKMIDIRIGRTAGFSLITGGKHDDNH